MVSSCDITSCFIGFGLTFTSGIDGSTAAGVKNDTTAVITDTIILKRPLNTLICLPYQKLKIILIALNKASKKSQMLAK